MFVDFDNVYTGLQALDPAAAKRFAEDPKHWTEALADGVAGDDSRRFLIRNCYLNPVIYSKYRPYWTRAGFRVIDCPSLTQRGKSSTDINLVLDAMDALSGAAHIEEFFVASADADFTSLVQRFRAADRMTTVIAAGAVAFAYREMADSVVESHDFVAILNGTAADVPRLVRSAKPAAAPRRHRSPPARDDRRRRGPRPRACCTGTGHRVRGGAPGAHRGPVPQDGLGRTRQVRRLDRPGRPGHRLRIHTLAGLGLGCRAVLTGPAARGRGPVRPSRNRSSG